MNARFAILNMFVATSELIGLDALFWKINWQL